jgi:DNA-directed RNA polymerase specialized sigma24 family protein
MEAIACDIESPVSSRTALFERLYLEAFPAVAAFVGKMNGTLQDAKDIFHDALIVYYEKSASVHWQPLASDEAYVLGIAKHLWIRKYKQDNRQVSLDVTEAQITLPEQPSPTVDDLRLLRLLESSGKKCMDLLRDFYQERLSLKKIMQRFGFGSERSAAVQKHKCLEKVRHTVQQKTMHYEDFWQ